MIAKPAAESGVLKIRVLTSWDEACPGSMSVDQINQHLRDGYRIVGTKTHTEMQAKADGVMRLHLHDVFTQETLIPWLLSKVWCGSAL